MFEGQQKSSLVFEFSGYELSYASYCGTGLRVMTTTENHCFDMRLELNSEFSLVSGERIVVSMLHGYIRGWDKAFKAFLEKKLLDNNPLNF